MCNLVEVKNNYENFNLELKNMEFILATTAESNMLV